MGRAGAALAVDALPVDAGKVAGSGDVELSGAAGDVCRQYARTASPMHLSSQGSVWKYQRIAFSA